MQVGESFEDAYGLLQSIISQLYVEHAYLEKCAEIDGSYKEIFTRLKRRQGNKTDVQISLRILICMMQIYYGKQVILLIDEYDVPMAKAGAKGYYNEMLDVIGTMMSQALKKIIQRLNFRYSQAVCVFRKRVFLQVPIILWQIPLQMKDLAAFLDLPMRKYENF